MNWRRQAGSVLLTFTLAAGLTASGPPTGRGLPPALARELGAAERHRRRVPRKVMVPKKPTPAHVAAQVAEWRNRLRRLIRQRGLTIAAVEKRLGWSTSYLNQVLQGTVVLKVERLLVLLDFFGGPLPEPIRRQIHDEARVAARATVAETLARWRAAGRGGLPGPAAGRRRAGLLGVEAFLAQILLDDLGSLLDDLRTAAVWQRCEELRAGVRAA